jgi:hypothetical protein
MVAAEIESPAITRAKLAREAMAECNNNRIQAVALYKRWLDDDPALRALLAPSFEDDAIAADVNGVDSATRRQLRVLAIRSAPDHPAQKRQANPDKGAAALTAILQMQRDDPDFHQWPLPGGMLLGEATPADVLLGAKFYAESAHTSRVNQRFLELVHEHMHGGTCVAKVLSHAALLRLRRRAEEE